MHACVNNFGQQGLQSMHVGIVTCWLLHDDSDVSRQACSASIMDGYGWLLQHVHTRLIGCRLYDNHSLQTR